MSPLCFPTFPYRIRTLAHGQQAIFDIVRKRYVHLTPEEWVRQHLLHYLVDHLNYPKALIRVERYVPTPTHRRQRVDLLVYTRSGIPLMLAECKAPSIHLASQALEQLGCYNAGLRTPFLVLTNGLRLFCWQLDALQNSYKALLHIPRFSH